MRVNIEIEIESQTCEVVGQGGVHKIEKSAYMADSDTSPKGIGALFYRLVDGIKAWSVFEQVLFYIGLAMLGVMLGDLAIKFTTVVLIVAFVIFILSMTGLVWMTHQPSRKYIIAILALTAAVGGGWLLRSATLPAPAASPSPQVSATPTPFGPNTSVVFASEQPSTTGDLRSGLNVVIINLGPGLAKNVTHASQVQTLFGKPADITAKEEDRNYRIFRIDDADEGTGQDMAPGRQITASFGTIGFGRMDDTDYANILNGSETLYLMGHIRYRDSAGLWDVESCQFMQVPVSSPLIWHFCRGHNRVIPAQDY
jgi:hypothetical protein